MMEVYGICYVNQIEGVCFENQNIDFKYDPEIENLLLQINTGNVDISEINTGGSDAAGEVNVKISENAGKLNHFQLCFLKQKHKKTQKNTNFKTKVYYINIMSINVLLT